VSDVERFRAAIEPYEDDFEEVLRVLELSSGFVMLPIVVPGPDLARMLAHWLSVKTRPTLVVEPENDEDWKNLASLLLNVKIEKNAVVVVIAGGDLPEDLSLPLRLVNERRDAIAKHLDCPLLWCGSSAFLVQTGQQAPDFWSVRAVERRIEARKRPESKKVSSKKELAKADLLDEAMRQGDRKSSEILFLSRMRKAMEEGFDDEFDRIVASVPEVFVEKDRKFAFELGLMRAEMDRRRGNIGDALKRLESLEEKIKKPDESCRLELLRGRVWERAWDIPLARKAYERACSSAPTSTYDVVAHLYELALWSRHGSGDGIPNLTRLRERAKKTTGSPSLDALAAAFLAEAMARQHDLRRAERILGEAIALREESKEEATILFGGEVAEAIRNAKAVIERAKETSVPPKVASDKNIVETTPKNPEKGVKKNDRFPEYIIYGGLLLAILIVLILSKLGIFPGSMYCFSGSDGKITCAKSLEECEKLRNASGAASAGPCQKPISDAPVHGKF